MKSKLTILIPNFNRPAALGRLLTSVFIASDAARANDQVFVHVVDDFSTDDITDTVSLFKERANFKYTHQAQKCGNAELAFLSALQKVDSEYTWLLGNDDVVMSESISHILRIIENSYYSFILLNPYISKAGMPTMAPLMSSSQSIIYDYCSDLFADWGFVTSTTTFPCLLFKTDPVRTFHLNFSLTDVATVYSHTFTLFGALAGQRALFLSHPLVAFTLNERVEEQVKLQRQAPKGIAFYHQSLGLARLIKKCAELTSFSIEWLGRAIEDELNKDTLIVQRTRLCHFLLFFFLEQIIREQTNLIRGSPSFTHLNNNEWKEIEYVVGEFNDTTCMQVFSQVRQMHLMFGVSPEWKVEALRRVQRSIISENATYGIQDGLWSPLAPLKLLVPNFTAEVTRGRPGDGYGRPVD